MTETLTEMIRLTKALLVAVLVAPLVAFSQAPCPETLSSDPNDSFGQGLTRLSRIELDANVVHRVLPDLQSLPSSSPIGGQVIVEVLVDKDGALSDARGVSGPEALQKIVVNAVRQWRFADSLPLPAVSHLCMSFRRQGVETRSKSGRGPEPDDGSIGVIFPGASSRWPKLPPEQGILVARVVLGGPADVAGIRKDDIITAVNGEAITGPAHFQNLVTKSEIGSEVTLTLLRRQENLSVTVKVARAGDVYKAGWQKKDALEVK